MYLYNYLHVALHRLESENPGYPDCLKTIVDKSKSCIDLANNLWIFTKEHEHYGKEHKHYYTLNFYSPIKLTSINLAKVVLTALYKACVNVLPNWVAPVESEFINDNFYYICKLLIDDNLYYKYNSITVFLSLLNTEEEESILKNAALTNLIAASSINKYTYDITPYLNPYNIVEDQ